MAKVLGFGHCWSCVLIDRLSTYGSLSQPKRSRQPAEQEVIPTTEHIHFIVSIHNAVGPVRPRRDTQRPCSTLCHIMLHKPGRLE
jgi:hypothetical protein